MTDLVDPVELPPIAANAARSPEDETILIEDLRFGVTVAMQQLSPRQRVAVILRHVCDQPLDDVAEALDTNSNAAKALLHRGRVALARARGATQTDVPTDIAVVQRLAEVIRARDIGGISALLTDDVWGVVDGGDGVPGATRPTRGRRAVARRFANAKRRLAQPVTAAVCLVNGEPAVAVRLASDAAAVAIVVPETQCGELAALRTIRDPRKLDAFFAQPSHTWLVLTDMNTPRLESFGRWFWETSRDLRSKAALIKYNWIEKSITAAAITSGFLWIGDVPAGGVLMVVFTNWP